MVTADVFGTIIGSETDVQTVGQDYTALGQTVDAIRPYGISLSIMLNGVFGLEGAGCPSLRNGIDRHAGVCRRIAGDSGSGEGCSTPWLQAFTATWVPGHISYNGTQIREQIQAVYDAGYEEWILWNATNRYSPDGLLAAGEEKQ